MIKRYAVVLSLVAFPLAGTAQITLDQADFPFQIGSAPYVNLSTSNEDGTNTALLEALIAQTGPDQTYDMTGVTFEDQLAGMIDVEAGATGPAAAHELLSQSTLTAVFPFVLDEDDLTAEGTIYFYHLVNAEGAYELGSFFLGETPDQTIAILITNTPDGQQDAAFPYTFGSTWNSTFTQTLNFDGFEVVSSVVETSEVDGWGTLLVPGVEGGVPALRVKVTTVMTTNGVESTDVCYELRTAQPLTASVCEGNPALGEPPTADVNRLGEGTTAGEGDSEPIVSALAVVYPNPTRETVTLGYAVPRNGPVEVTLYDVLGRPVQRVVTGTRAAGTYSEAIDVSGLPSGHYFARLTVAGEHWVRPFRVVR